LDFLIDNIIWVALAVASGAMLLWPMLRGGGTAELSPSEAVLLINREHALVVDVREEAEFAGGHIADAKNLPLSQLKQRLDEIAKYKQKPVLVNCLSGTRTGVACSTMKAAGFTRLYVLKGGVNAWKQANLPLVKG